MIVGIGTDLCDVNRMAQAMSRHGDAFAQRILGPQEWQVFCERRQRSPDRAMKYLGTRFAVKEAFSKAIGLGMTQPMAWQRCETLNNEQGRPLLVLHGDLAAWMAERGWQAHVSISDEGHLAQAFVIIESTPTETT